MICNNARGLSDRSRNPDVEVDGDLLVRDAPVCLSLYALDAEDDEPRDVER